MGDITQPAAIGATIPDDQHGRGDGGRHPARHKAYAATPRQSVDDVAFIMGIPGNEFTPKVEEALAIIMAEFDRQRAENERAKDRIAFLEEQADTHEFLPLPNRRAFLRALSVVQTRAGHTQTRSSLVVLSLRNAEAIRWRGGRAALDVALIATANSLREGVRASDSIGSLGGADFGLILTFTGESAAVEKAETVIQRIRETPVEWNAERITLDVRFGVCDFSGSDGLRHVLDAAERDLLERVCGTEAAGRIDPGRPG